MVNCTINRVGHLFIESRYSLDHFCYYMGSSNCLNATTHRDCFSSSFWFLNNQEELDIISEAISSIDPTVYVDYCKNLKRPIILLMETDLDINLITRVPVTLT